MNPRGGNALMWFHSIFSSCKYFFKQGLLLFISICHLKTSKKKGRNFDKTYCKFYLVDHYMSILTSQSESSSPPWIDVGSPWLLLLNILMNKVWWSWICGINDKGPSAVGSTDMEWHHVGQQLSFPLGTEWTKLPNRYVDFLRLNSATLCSKSQQKYTRKGICNVWAEMVQ